jgi:NADPH-dependent 2,4-dienoyl-CoA reductase/sulfur reductase-like enzyme
MADLRVIVVGAGPAGVRAAEVLVEAGLRPAVVDEGRNGGGQIYRRQPENFRRSYAALYGTEAERAAALHSCFDGLREKIDYHPETLVWGLWENQLKLMAGNQATSLAFDALIICAGATDRLMPVPGWTRAGVYSLGGAQIALKAQACTIGRRVVFMGTGPLLYLVAAQYLAAGAEVAAVLDTSPIRLRLRALPKLLTRPTVLGKGLALVARLRRAGIEIQTGIEPLEIAGSDADGVVGVTFRTPGGAARLISCDAVGLGYHLRPETQLADLARCGFHFDTVTRQWLPKIDQDGRSTRPGVYLAGDGARICGADAAETAGRLAALAVLADTGHAIPSSTIAELRARLANMARFAEGLAAAFPWPAAAAGALPDETIVCRCEAITAGEVRAVACGKGASELNRAKAFSRIGMGRCQGRYCGNAAGEIIAAATGLPLESIGRLRGQAPIKPLAIGTKRAEEVA